MTQKIIQQGAEAIIILSGNEIIKRRIKKDYRIKVLDERIRKLRTRGEGKLLKKAAKEIPVPKVIKVDERSKEIKMDFIKGQKLSDNLDSFSVKKQKQIMRQIGESISKLHSKEIIHGDLTTSNMILGAMPSGAGFGKIEEHSRVYFIDFGLGYHSRKDEDKAVDIHLLKQALEAKHFKNWKILFKEFEKGYLSENKKNSEDVLNRLKIVEKRGRYKRSHGKRKRG